MSTTRQDDARARRARTAQRRTKHHSVSGRLGDLRVSVPSGAMWVFAYGSLMWNPGFVYEESVRATLPGYRRSLCLWSWVYRGTRENPGLCLGLAPGGECDGIAFRIAEDRVAATLAYLHQREIHADEYLPCIRPIVLENGSTAAGFVLLANVESRQYAGDLDTAVVMRSIRGASGTAGSNRDYVLTTHRHCLAIGASDDYLSAIAASLTEAADAQG